MEKRLLFQVLGVFCSLLLLIPSNSLEAKNESSSKLAGCWAPPDITLDCLELTFDPSDLNSIRAALGSVDELYRNGKLTIEVDGNFTLKEKIDWKSEECSAGTLVRTFIVNVNTYSGPRLVECSQTIKIINNNDYLIKFPADGSETCRGDAGNDLSTTNFGCDVLAINRDTSVFGSAGDACFKRRIVYRVINWCEYDGLTLQPTIIPRDVDCDSNLEECTWVRVEDGEVWIDDDDKPKDEPVITFKKGAASYQSLSCDDKTYPYTRGFWQYTQFIKVYDNEAPDIIVNGDFEFCANGQSGAADCMAEVMIPFIARDACTQAVELRSVKISVNGAPAEDLKDQLYTVEETRSSFTIRSIAGEGLPEGNHVFIISVADECGNLTSKNIPFTIEDCKSPAPICTAILSVDLMPVVENKEVIGGENEIWAVDFVASGVIDCTPHSNPDVIPGSANNIRYYVVRLDSLEANGLRSPNKDYLTDDYRSVKFTCEDNGSSLVVYVIGEDGVGNFDFCTVLVSVHPGVDPDPCNLDIDTTSRVAIAGLISTADGDAIEGVEVSLSGQLQNTLHTNEEGSYSFEGLSGGYDYTITPSLEEDMVNGLSTFDLVIITKHILGVDTLDSPYKILAADVNNSQSITALDLIQVRKLILSIDTEFKNSSSWIFVPKSYVFNDPQNPWDEEMPYLLNLNNLREDLNTADFIGVKKGDVNGSAIANSRMAQPRNVKGKFEIITKDLAMKAGNEYTIPFTSEELTNIQGYQFTLGFDHTVLEIVDINYGIATEEHFGLTHVAEGVITTSWNHMGGLKSPKAVKATEDLFSIVVRAKSDAILSDMISIGSRYTQAEAYNQAGQHLDVALSFGERNPAFSGFELYQNNPNPFVNQTQIGFELANAAKVTLSINDVTGKTIKVIRGDFSEGYHNLILEDIPAGVMYYTLTAGEFTATKKMIKFQ